MFKAKIFTVVKFAPGAVRLSIGKSFRISTEGLVQIKDKYALNLKSGVF